MSSDPSLGGMRLAGLEAGMNRSDLHIHCANLSEYMNKEEVLLWLAEVFEESPEYIQPERLRDDVPTWDSVGVLNLMAGIDEKFGILLSDKEIRSMNKVGDILTLLESKGKIK